MGQINTVVTVGGIVAHGTLDEVVTAKRGRGASAGWCSARAVKGGDSVSGRASAVG